MNDSSNVLVLGVTGQVGKRVYTACSTYVPGQNAKFQAIINMPMAPTGRLSVADTGVFHSASEGPSAKAARWQRLPRLRSASDAVRRPVDVSILYVAVVCVAILSLDLSFSDSALAVLMYLECAKMHLDTYPNVR